MFIRLLIINLLLICSLANSADNSANIGECNPGLCAQFGPSYPGCPCQSDPTKPSTTYVPAVQQGGWNQSNSNANTADNRNLPSADRSDNGAISPQSGSKQTNGSKGQSSSGGNNNNLAPLIPALMLAPLMMNGMGGKFEWEVGYIEQTRGTWK